MLAINMRIILYYFRIPIIYFEKTYVNGNLPFAVNARLHLSIVEMKCHESKILK